jgi:site-specific recombinase XerD
VVGTFLGEVPTLPIVEQPGLGGVRPRRSEGTRDASQSPSTLDGSLKRQFEPLLQQLRESADLSTQSRAKFLDLLDRFASFLSVSQEVESLTEVTRVHVLLFIRAPSTKAPTEPAAATMHLRRSAIRLLFRLARDSGLEINDPTLDIKLPRRSRRPMRPLTDAEIEVCRAASLRTLHETRLPAAWALAEATARTSELASIRASDVDLSSGVVRICGSSKTHPRHGFFTDWGIQQVRRRLDTLTSRRTEGRAIIYEGDRGGASGQASASTAIAWTMRRAGLSADAAVQPASVAAWAGRRLYEQGIALEEVARRLGIRSLDRTASFIGLDLGRP